MFDQQSRSIGGIMRAPPGEPAHWQFYTWVPAINVARKAAAELDGAIVIEPMEISGGQFSLVARDPQGAHFGLVGLRKGE